MDNETRECGNKHSRDKTKRDPQLGKSCYRRKQNTKDNGTNEGVKFPDEEQDAKVCGRNKWTKVLEKLKWPHSISFDLECCIPVWPVLCVKQIP
mmetsp:Transcript_23461/g.49933  ORF Transcript_23461/g.49933 Transcript_23461/m.49933 type:complete len:94 (-) Transcript_23461:2031-2312(-)